MKPRVMILSLICVMTLSCLQSATAAEGRTPRPAAVVPLKSMADAAEAERIMRAALGVAPERRLIFVSRCLLGRRYHPETRKRIKSQHQPPKPKQEADNEQPQPVTALSTSLQYLDCMTYVEHVLALTYAERPDYTGAFLPRLIDIMFDAGGAPLVNHLRNHFTSHWAEVNARKGYLVDIAREHPLAVTRTLTLNRVGANRTFYVADRFMIASAPTTFWYVPLAVVLARQAPLMPGDIVALVCDKEGLDVTHMGFFMETQGKAVLRHASLTRNRVTDEDFYAYMAKRKGLTGLMILRPRLPPRPPAPFYRCLVTAVGGK